MHEKRRRDGVKRVFVCHQSHRIVFVNKEVCLHVQPFISFGQLLAPCVCVCVHQMHHEAVDVDRYG